MIKTVLSLLVAMTLLPQSAWAADPARGKALARQRCAGCHDIDGGSRRGRSRPPSFGEIARRPGAFTASQLSIYMTFSHRPMGAGLVGLGDAGDLAAYILTLRR